VIDFRYHIVSIVAIFFALGAGVLLGAGPLKNAGASVVQDQADRDRAALEQAREDLIQAKAMDKYRDDYVTKVTSVLVSGRLKDRKVALVTMPQADGGLVDNLTSELEDAGAQVTTRVSLDSKLFATEQQQLLNPLVNQLVTADVTFEKDSTTYQRAGQILARGIAATTDGQAVDDNATRILSGLTGSKLFSVKPTPKDRATLIVVVAGKQPAETTDENTYTDAVDLAQGLDSGSAGVVVAGTPETSEDGALLKVMRSDSDATKQVSSVDVANLPSGRATVVFALVEQEEGKAGQYGGMDAKDGVAPKAVLVPQS
jgi:Copper transport outer membrane protein, MctB